MSTGRTLALFVVVGGALLGQSAVLDTLAIKGAFNFVGPPPDVLGFHAMVQGGRLVTDPLIAPKGPVARMEYKEYDVAKPNEPPLRDLTRDFDENGKIVAEIDIRGSSETKTTLSYWNGKILTCDSTKPFKGYPQAWSDRWSYDPAGRLTAFHRKTEYRGLDSGYEMKYDAQGRPSAEYDQPSRGPVYKRVEYEYSTDGRIVTVAQYDTQGTPVAKSTETLDDKGRLIGSQGYLIDWKTHERSQSVSEFEYDEQGRVTMQLTRWDVPPKDIHATDHGNVRIVYDEANRTVHATYLEGPAQVVSISTLNQDGAVISVSTTRDGAEADRFEFNCVSDGYGNWTDCKPSSIKGSERRLTGWWTRTITYR